MQQLVVTAVGPDRPGLVGEFTGHLFNAGANIADSRMVNLRGQFALILLVEGTEQKLAEVQKTLQDAAKRSGLTVSYAALAGTAAPVAGLPFKLKTYSMDQPGIVHRVSNLLQKHGVNIEELQTRLESQPFMGTPLFTMELRITVPQTVQVKSLRAELQALCDQLNCDLDLEPA
ncbi:MAG: ACT domain-containing protein [Myxococcota bacterium]